MTVASQHRSFYNNSLRVLWVCVLQTEFSSHSPPPTLFQQQQMVVEIEPATFTMTTQYICRSVSTERCVLCRSARQSISWMLAWMNLCCSAKSTHLKFQGVSTAASRRTNHLLITPIHLMYLTIVASRVPVIVTASLEGPRFTLRIPTCGLAQDASAATKKSFAISLKNVVNLKHTKEALQEPVCSRNSEPIVYMRLALSPFVVMV